jgi:hypothetical protein
LFTFKITYYDSDNDPPDCIWVFIDDEHFDMQKVDPSDNNYTDGVVYYYNTTVSRLTNHTHYFFANSTSPIQDNYTTEVYTGPIFYSKRPTLSNGCVIPSSGYPGLTEFSYRVTYTDLNNDTPSVVLVYIDNNPHIMTKLDPADFNYVDGVVYNFLITLERAVHNYYFWANSSFVLDGSVRLPFSGIYSGPSVNTIPTLTNPSVTPTSGVAGTEFIWLVTYTDADNNAPSFIYVYINGAQRTMTKQNPLDNDYTDGCVYRYTAILTVAGNYTYYFYASDGIDSVRLPSVGSYANPSVSAPESPPIIFDFQTMVVIIVVLVVIVAGVSIFIYAFMIVRKGKQELSIKLRFV